MPFFYWSFRTNLLAASIISFILWPITGINVAEGYVPIIGIQWTTFSTFCLFFYLLMLNFQVGGLHSLTQLGYEVRQDLFYLVIILRHLWTYTRRPYILGKEYPSAAVVDGPRAATITVLVCLGALLAFEAIWVPLYDFFQFGSIDWPVYSAQSTSTLQFSVFDRNTFDTILPLIFAGMVLGLAYDYGGPTAFARFWHLVEKDFEFMEHRFKVKWRIDWYWGSILIGTAWLWLAWIYFPHSMVNISQLPASQIMGQLAKDYSPSACYVFPSQHLFPQNTYTFYPCSAYLKTYPLNQILGFFYGDTPLHLLNIATKYATFLSICYPFMAKVRLNL